MSYQITLSDVTYRSRAAEARRLNASPDALAKQYIEEHIAERRNRDRWRDEMQKLFESIQARLPEMASEDIEADITAARAEVKELRRARQRADQPPRLSSAGSCCLVG